MTKSKLVTELASKNVLEPIKFTDYAIDRFQYDFKIGSKTKNRLVKFTNAGLKGLKLKIENTKRKYFVQQYWFNGMSHYWSVGEFSLHKFGIKECRIEVNKIMDDHTDDDGLWIKNPKITKKLKKLRITKAELENRKLLTVNQCIEKLCQANFPKIRKTGTLTGKSIVKISLPLIGYNKRTKHLVHNDDVFGNGKITFKACKQYNTTQPKDWNDLFAKFPPGHGLLNTVCGKKMTGVSIYDHDFGKYLIEELTPGIINNFIDEIPRGWATKNNMIDALQVLWANSKKYMGSDRPSNPTTREALDVKTFDVSRGKNSKYNRRKIEPKDLQKMWLSLQKLSLKHPFQAECLMLMMVSGRRSTEILKTLKSNVFSKGKKDNEFGMDNIIVLPATITKNRENSFIIITEPVQFVLDKLDELYLRPKLMKYKFIPHLFPTTKSVPKSWLDDKGNIKREYVYSRKTRLVDIRECWKTMLDDAGLRNIVPRMLRKSYASMSVKRLKTSATARKLTGHVKASTLDIHYDIHNQEQIREYATQVAESFVFTTKDNS